MLMMHQSKLQSPSNCYTLETQEEIGRRAKASGSCTGGGAGGERDNFILVSKSENRARAPY